MQETQELIPDLATESDQLEFPVLYAVAKQGTAATQLDDPQENLQPLFQTIVETVPPKSKMDHFRCW